MKLSIIVPVYNMAADNKLTWCLDSLINQTISDYEIIAVDDCSTDESMDILRDYEARYPDKFRSVSCFSISVEKATATFLRERDSCDAAAS